ncbi:MAG: poly(A) polymerase [Bdellovibrionales bacterium]|nr:poly(A) polymerase [Bdellovibrionales bacterium]
MTHSLPLNKQWIDSHAFKLVKALQDHNHTTYLVGGCVRDLLLGLPPKDFDIATSALPNQVNKIIRPSYIIGRRFQLVLVKRYGQQYEISTFRANTQEQENDDEVTGPIMDDNTFGDPEQDAKRRDFTINSFFYDPVKCELIDYTNGLSDIEQRVVRMIGDPHVRIQEDPLRMLRALRFAHKANFQIEESLRNAIFELADQLPLSVLPRRREEMLKFLRLPTANSLIWECHDLTLLQHLCPTLNHILEKHDSDIFEMKLNCGLEAVSDMYNPNELFAVLLFAMISAKIPSFGETLELKDHQIEALMVMMKNELGMYRVEQDLFFQTLSFIKQLQEIDNPERIRDRYRNHLVKNNSMAAALTLCSAHKLIPGPHLYYWANEYFKAHP